MGWDSDGVVGWCGGGGGGVVLVMVGWGSDGVVGWCWWW